MKFLEYSFTCFAQNVKFIMVAVALSSQAALAIILKGFDEVKHQSIVFIRSTYVLGSVIFEVIFFFNVDNNKSNYCVFVPFQSAMVSVPYNL